MRSPRWPSTALCALALVAGCRASYAATVSSSTSIGSVIATTCSITSVTNPSATLTSGGTATKGGYGGIYIQCTQGSTFTVALGPGLYGTDAATPTRYIENGTNKLQYQIFQDSGYSKPWGDISGTNTESATGTGSASPLWMWMDYYPAPMTLPAGTYTDTVNITVSY